MTQGPFRKLLPHLIAVIVFLIVAAIYCKPALQGKVLSQGDITHWKAMFEDMRKYKETHGHLPLWSNGMFSGMPGYQIGLEPYNPATTSYFHGLFSLWLPKPLNFFFLACICFYFLSQVLRVNPYLGIIGALAYAYSTYNPVIISAGHDTKMMSLGYMPALLGSILLIYEKKYLLGSALTALVTSLIVGANHPQIIFYALLIIVIMSVAYAIRWIRQKEFKHLAMAFSIALAAGIVGVMSNAVSLITTYEYSKKSIRGGSVLADSTSKETKTGLSTGYALSYSLYKTEPLVMMFPRLYGGSSYTLEVPEEKSKAFDALRSMPQQLGQQLQQYLAFYWGGINDGVGTAGPPYTGAIICFLALIGFVILDDKHKWWILSATVLAIVMSWGKYFEGFSSFLLAHLPLYDKFRAPSMIMVIPNILFCMMAMLSVQKIITTTDKDVLWASYKKGLLVLGGVFLVALMVYFNAEFTSEPDKALLRNVNQIADPQQKQAIMEPVRSFIAGLKADREGLFLGDLLRSLLYIAVAGIAIWLYIKKKINTAILLGTIGVFAFIDVIVIDLKYLNEDRYQEEADYANNFIPSEIDKAIAKDSSYFRVFDLSGGVSDAFANAKSSYFFKSIGGYHPAKLSIYQDLIEKQLFNFPNCMPVVNMLNTKYFIVPNQQTGQPEIQQNPGNLGACWFVKAVKFEKGPAAMMNALTGFNPKDTVIAYEKDRSLVMPTAETDSTSSIQLIMNDNDVAEYQSVSRTGQFAVFSEIYYDKGWTAYIDSKEAPIVNVNYVLRGLSVPAGNHKIRFEFKPASYYESEKLAIVSSSLVWILLIGTAIQTWRRRKREKFSGMSL